MKTEQENADMKYNSRNVPAVDIRQGTSVTWPLENRRGKDNTNAYKLYYYLLSKSAIQWSHSPLQKTTYYVSKNRNYWSKREASMVLGVSERTITNNLHRLIQENLIYEEEKRYVFRELTCWVPLHWDIMRVFMGLEGVLNWEFMIRMYSILIYAWLNGVKNFTAADIFMALNIGKGNPMRSPMIVSLCLSWWENLGLINYTFEEKINLSNVKYNSYYLKSIENSPTMLVRDLLSKDAGEISQSWIDLLAA